MEVRLVRINEIRKYIIDVLLFGFILGFTLFLLLLLFSASGILKSATIGITTGICIVFVIQLLRYILKVFIGRKNLLKKLSAENLKILNAYGIYLQNDLFFKGTYKGFSINVYPQKNSIKNDTKLHFTINIYYNYPNNMADEVSRWKFDQEHSKQYKIGSINFGGHVAILHPNDEYTPDFKISIGTLIDKLQELELTPMDFRDWEKKYILPLEEKHKKERNQFFSLFKRTNN